MNSLRSYIKPSITLISLSGIISLTNVAQATSIETLWNFDFTGEITGDGFIEITEHQNGEGTNIYEVTDLQFILDFGDGSGSNNVTLTNFSVFTQPLFFSPDESSKELLHTDFFAQFVSGADPIQSEWIQGTINGVGGFTMSGSGEGANTPDDPQGVGGIIIFTSFDASPVQSTGTWTAQPVPEPLTILGSLTALGFGTFFKRSLKERK